VFVSWPANPDALFVSDHKAEVMARRTLNRLEMRKQADQADQAGPVDPAAPGESAPGVDSAEAPVKKKAKAKAAAPKVKKPRKPKAPVRLCARWGVFDSGMKQVAIFDYNQRAAADQKILDLSAKKNGTFFLQIVKEPMPEPAPVEAPPV
jgi:hypothetical protein